MKYTYLIINIFSAIVPFIFSFHPRIKFHRLFRTFIKANLISALIFIVWDVIFTSKNVWAFNPKYNAGLNIVNLPLEEVLFFIFIPFACVFTYYCSFIFFRVNWKEKTQDALVLLISLFIFIVGIIFISNAYTATAFISTAIFLMLIRFYFKAEWLPQFFSVYPVLLIPFIIVNGILTGTGLEQPVVEYNSAEIIGMRVFTIPIEDFVYCLELLLLNVFLFEKFRNTSVAVKVKSKGT